jgi:hypothetical protein
LTKRPWRRSRRKAKGAGASRLRLPEEEVHERFRAPPPVSDLHLGKWMTPGKLDTPADYPTLAPLITRTRETRLELAEAVRRSRQLREESRRLRTYRPAPCRRMNLR